MLRFGLVRSLQHLPLADLTYAAQCRGVAQPGRAPGSGPGGRRFKSSLPDQSFQRLKLHFWISVYTAVGNFVGGKILGIPQADFHWGIARRIPTENETRALLAQTRNSTQS